MRLVSRIRVLIGVAATLAASGCSDAPTAPKPLDAAEVARVLPAITDARLRLVPGISTAAVRDRVADDLGQIERALTRSDVRSAILRTRLLRSLLADYAAQPGSTEREDAADLMAVAFALLEVAALLDLPVALSEFH